MGREGGRGLWAWCGRGLWAAGRGGILGVMGAGVLWGWGVGKTKNRTKEKQQQQQNAKLVYEAKSPQTRVETQNNQIKEKIKEQRVAVA